MLKWLTFFALICYASSISFESRIVEGNGIDITTAPYVVSLRFKSPSRPNKPYKHHCGGAILSKDTVITAADCVEGYEPENFIVVAGTSNTAGSDGVIVRVKTIIVHPEYDFNSIKFNVALLKLKTNLNLDGFKVSAIELSEKKPDSGRAVLSGYGKVQEDGEASEVLKQVEIPILSQYFCRQLYSPDEISSDMFCAGNIEGGADGCEGDAGSPLMLKPGGTLVGILSFGKGCGREGYPSVYTSMGTVYSWIIKEL